MDVKCKWCGEPWDIYEMHDVVKALNGNPSYGGEVTFDDVRQLFYAWGCAAFSEGWEGTVPTKQTCVVVEEMTDEQKTRRAALDVMQELSGSDIDGLAADLEDFEAIGLL